jgi:exodeoxyribonuclease V alpha subunit
VNKDSAFEVINGVIENVVYRNESNDYTVLEIADEKGELITAVGIIPMAFEGETVILNGNWTFHKEFGKQFSFDSYEKRLPEEADGILQYLSSSTVKGVGPVTALKIVNKFGVDSFDVIENHPEWLTDIPGITMKKAAVISESFRAQTGIRGVMMFCKDYLGTGEVTKVYKKLGAGAVGIIKENPYILCDEEYGISFEKIDAFAKTLDISPTAQVRILSAIKYTLSYNGIINGHTCLPEVKLVSAVALLIEVEESVIAESVKRFVEEGKMISYKVDGAVYIMTPEVSSDEKFIAKRLYQLEEDVSSFSATDTGALLEKLEARYGIQYAKLQKDAIFEALRGGAMILTGGPGTGKTTVIKALISIFDSLGMKCVLAAPTGRAAKRMSEATSSDAKTIHRMLEMERSTDMDIKFGRNEKNPLDESVVIIDEASMMDLSLTVALLRAMRRGARLILIGDADQLPSVGAGNIFLDLISSGRIKTIRLTEIFRQSKESLIITNAHKINSGETPVLTVADNDFFMVKRENEREIPKTIADLVTKRLPKAYGSSISEQIQIITPSKKGAGGVEILNAELQSQINPPAKFKREKSHHGITFREGDRVMQTANNYDIEWERNGIVGTGIFNGDIGIIDSINPSKNEMVIRFDDRIVTYDFDLLDELELAYAITVHKSQGSEYPVVIIPMYYCAPMLMSRNLLYTAVTRARRMVILVGKPEVPGIMVNNNREILRYTTLCQRIIAYFK